jgi:hypothetical protein
MTSGNSRTTWRHRTARWLGVAAGALAVTVGGKPSLTEAAPDEGKASATSATTSSAMQIPVAWQDFAKSLQRQFQERLASNNDAALRFHDAMARLAGEMKPAPSVLLRVWIMADGRLDRIEIDGRASDQASRDLVAAVGGVDRPPSDMPQPLRMRLSLAAKDRPENRQ